MIPLSSESDAKPRTIECGSHHPAEGLGRRHVAVADGRHGLGRPPESEAERGEVVAVDHTHDHGEGHGQDGHGTDEIEQDLAGDERPVEPPHREVLQAPEHAAGLAPGEDG